MQTVKEEISKTAAQNDADLRLFLVVLRQALLMIVSWIETRYKLRPSGVCPHCGQRL